jgi:hypothetical protein
VKVSYPRLAIPSGIANRRLREKFVAVDFSGSIAARPRNE